MSPRRRGGARGFTARTLVVATALALVAAVGFAVGGAGAAQKSVRPIKGIGVSHNGIIEASRYLGRNSRIPVQVSPNKVVTMKQAVRQAKRLQAKQARIRKHLRSSAGPLVHGRLAGGRHYAGPGSRSTTALGFYRKQLHAARSQRAHRDLGCDAGARAPRPVHLDGHGLPGR